MLNLPSLSVLKLLYIIFLSLGCSRIWSEAQIMSLSGLEIGNGIALHPRSQILFISAPSSQMNEDNDRPFYRIYKMENQNGEWSPKQEAPFSGFYNDYHPVFNHDGTQLYFNSTRPISGQSNNVEKVDIWRVSYQDENYGTPKYLKDINTEHHESYPSIARDGTLYFNSDRPGGKGSMDLYKAEPKGDGYEKPELLTVLNSIDSENDLVIDPEERFIIFNRYLFDSGEIELYISFKERTSWSEPSPLYSVNRRDKWELTPSLSPGGNFFLYELDGKITVLPMDSILVEKHDE